jgi:hypothetical protein
MTQSATLIAVVRLTHLSPIQLADNWKSPPAIAIVGGLFIPIPKLRPDEQDAAIAKI